MDDRFVTIACHKDRKGSIIGYRIIDTKTSETKDVTRRSAENAAAGLSAERLQIVLDRDRYPCIMDGKASGIRIKTAYKSPTGKSGGYLLSDYNGNIEKVTEKDILKMVNSDMKSVSNMKQMYGRLYEEKYVTDINETGLTDEEKKHVLKRIGKRYCIIKAKIEPMKHEVLIKSGYAVDFKTFKVVTMDEVFYVLGINMCDGEDMHEDGDYYIFNFGKAADNILPVNKAYTFEEYGKHGVTDLDTHLLPVCEVLNCRGHVMILASNRFKFFNKNMTILSLDSIVKKNKYSDKAKELVYGCIIDESKDSIHMDMAAEKKEYSISGSCLNLGENSKVREMRSLETKSRLTGNSMIIKTNEEGVITHLECPGGGEIKIPKGAKLGNHALAATEAIKRVTVPGSTEFTGSIVKSGVSIDELWLEDARVYGRAVKGFDGAMISKLSVGNDINGYELYSLIEMSGRGSTGIEIRGGISDSALDKVSELILDWAAGLIVDNKVNTAEVIETGITEKITAENINKINIQCSVEEQYIDGESIDKGIYIRLVKYIGALSASSARARINSILKYEPSRKGCAEQLEAEVDKYVANYESIYQTRYVSLTEKLASGVVIPARLKESYMYSGYTKTVCDIYRTDMGKALIGVIKKCEDITASEHESLEASSGIDGVCIPKDVTVFAFGADELKGSGVVKEGILEEINSRYRSMITGERQAKA